MPDDASLIFMGNMPAIYGKKIQHYQDPIFLKRSQIEPPEKSDKILVNAPEFITPQNIEAIDDLKIDNGFEDTLLI